MERREGMSSSGVTVVGSDAPSDYHVAARTDTATHFVPPQQLTAFAGTATVRKKISRPRKHGPDGSVTKTKAPSSNFVSSSQQREEVRGSGSSNRELNSEVHDLGDLVACNIGANFTPHIITVNSGEDITMKVISFSQQGPRALCVLSANGVISSVTLRQPDSSGGTLTYEGRFEILSLSGSFMPTDGSGPTRSRSGGLSISLASPDGRILGGGVAGFLLAAGPVQVVMGSFIAASEKEAHKHKKQKPVPQTHPSIISGACSTQMEQVEVPADPKVTSLASSFNWPSNFTPHGHPNIDITSPRK